MMASYNGEKFIREQIDSLMRQKDVQVSLLVRDDSSKDGTVQILNEYKEKGMLDWYTGEHLGVEKNFLDLMRHAPQADYYAFCDQDDVWEEEKLIRAVEMLQQTEEHIPAVYYSSLNLVDEQLNYISTHHTSKRSDCARFIFPGMAGCTMVFNRTLLEECNRYMPAYLRMHDVWVYNVCMALGGVAYADDRSYIGYRQHGSNAVGLKKGSIKSVYQIYVVKSYVARHMECLLDGYGDRMVEPYHTLCKHLVASNRSIKSRWKLLFDKNIRFQKKGFRMIFILKVLQRKM